MSTELAQELKLKTTAVRLMTSRWGIRKSLTKDQRVRAADEFSASQDTLSISKKLVDTKDERYKKVTGILSRAKAYWLAMTVDFPEDGIRLLRTDRIQEWENGIFELQQEMIEAVGKLDQYFYDLKQKARHDLGQLYNDADYPATICGMFRIDYEYPSTEPDSRLAELHPEIYAREQERIRAKFDEAIQLTEQAFIAELHGLLSHMVERLSGADDGKKKIFKNSTVDNIHEFIDRFKQLNLGSNAELDATVEQVKQIVNGVDPKSLRNSDGLQKLIAVEIDKVRDKMDAMMIDRNKRKFKVSDEVAA